jgi:hypothetical protein
MSVVKLQRTTCAPPVRWRNRTIANQEAELEDDGDQAVMRGLGTAFPAYLQHVRAQNFARGRRFELRHPKPPTTRPLKRRQRRPGAFLGAIQGV